MAARLTAAARQRGAPGLLARTVPLHAGGSRARDRRHRTDDPILHIPTAPPPAHGRGPTATYDLGHLVRLRAIALLKANRLPLDQIRQRLVALGDDEIAAMLQVETAPPEESWRRIRLHADLELFVRERRGKDKDDRFEATVETIKMIVRDQLGDEGEETRSW